MQAKLCGLIAMDALLVAMEADNWPGKAQETYACDTDA